MACESKRFRRHDARCSCFEAAKFGMPKIRYRYSRSTQWVSSCLTINLKLNLQESVPVCVCCDQADSVVNTKFDVLNNCKVNREMNRMHKVISGSILESSYPDH